ncbi:CBS domain-containing protein [Marinilabiliaceae bacterium JC017]|nr:CBS domain-containing protein [Marinilabiliaceae bacterium JC017]
MFRAADLVCNCIPALKSSDTGLDALNWMEVFRISHLPIVDKGLYLGLISDLEIYDLNMANNPIIKSLVFPKLTKVFVDPSETDFYKVISDLNDNKLTIIPVVDKDYRYVGMITLQEVLKHLTQYPNESFILPLQEELVTCFKQYLTFFNDYIKISKGKSYRIELEEVHGGIKVKTNVNSRILFEEVKLLLGEFLNYLKTNISELKINVET